jgi:hypothetical protein
MIGFLAMTDRIDREMKARRWGEKTVLFQLTLPFNVVILLPNRS